VGGCKVSAQFSVFLNIKPGFWEAFLAASRVNQANARQEPGNMRFDIYRSTENPALFLFVEEYDSDESVNLHRETRHFLSWLEAATPMMVEPRQRVPGNDVPPGYAKI
jgi:quinol monooxygenase YgiN